MGKALGQGTWEQNSPHQTFSFFVDRKTGATSLSERGWYSSIINTLFCDHGASKGLISVDTVSNSKRPGFNGNLSQNRRWVACGFKWSVGYAPQSKQEQSAAVAENLGWASAGQIVFMCTMASSGFHSRYCGIEISAGLEKTKKNQMPAKIAKDKRQHFELNGSNARHRPHGKPWSRGDFFPTSY
ncbi:hypothetical protein POX_d05601 [Penicillium oxalicum]|uniref:hypothetical protein n=1 Tax=Penicillium oxalicum TaxID=69781 RepID=UPI0020B72B94|nr:hypothetical protein POX_d05601 [Penicillium oxalicum]KAI2790097.1 hypothetical protein POX_d05601 [Penicillium oxalicum]